MKTAIMQPYFFPYVGYFHLLHAADNFVVYDNIKYTKKGWINRNRFLQNGEAVTFSVSLSKGSDSLNVNERRISPDFNRAKLLNQIKNAYQKAPYFEQAYGVFEDAINCEKDNLFEFIHHSIQLLMNHLGISTNVVCSSKIEVDHSLRGQDKVIALCKSLDTSIYVNAAGGKELYSASDFTKDGMELRFIESSPFEYKQYDQEFVPWLSILDVLMFNSKETVMDYLSSGYKLVSEK